MEFVNDFDLLKGEDISLEAVNKYPGDTLNLPYYLYSIRDNKTNKIAGKVVARLGSNYQTTYLGNVDIEIFDNFRGHKYSYKVIELLFPLFRFYTIDNIYLACEDSNYACRRVIELVGGQLLESEKLPDDLLGTKKDGRINCVYFLEIPPEDYELTERDEHSSMSIVISGTKLLVLESIDHKLNLPKGHLEKGESSLEACIRECKEETGIDIYEDEYVTELEPMRYSFSGKEFRNMNDLMFFATFGVCRINKTVDVHVFRINSLRTPHVTETDHFIDCKWMDIEEFLYSAPYQDQINAVSHALDVL